MKKLKAGLIVLLLIAGLRADVIQACDQFGRTELINFVIQAENEISRSKKELKKLWDTYFYNQKIHDDNIRVRNNSSIPSYQYIAIRKIYTTDADVALYRQKEQEFSKFILQATEKIIQIAGSDVDVNAKDHDGNTALNYCYTYELYDALCSQGGSFQLRPWIYFNPCTSILIGMATVSTVLITIPIGQILADHYAGNQTTNQAH